MLNREGMKISGNYSHIKMPNLDIEIPLSFGGSIRIYVCPDRDILEDDIVDLPEAFNEAIDIIKKAYC